MSRGSNLDSNLVLREKSNVCAECKGTAYVLTFKCKICGKDICFSCGVNHKHDCREKVVFT